MRIWLNDENGKPSASLTLLAISFYVPLTMWVIWSLGLIPNAVDAAAIGTISGAGIVVYTARKGQKEGWDGNKKSGSASADGEPEVPEDA